MLWSMQNQICHGIGNKEGHFEERNSSNNSHLELKVRVYFKRYSLLFINFIIIAIFCILLQATVILYRARTTSHVLGYKNFDTQGNFIDLLCRMNNLITFEN